MWPSGSASFTASAASRPAAPERLSMISGPRLPRTASAIARVRTSCVPPAGTPISTLIGCVGNDCACAARRRVRQRREREAAEHLQRIASVSPSRCGLHCVLLVECGRRGASFARRRGRVARIGALEVIGPVRSAAIARRRRASRERASACARSTRLQSPPRPALRPRRPNLAAGSQREPNVCA